MRSSSVIVFVALITGQPTVSVLAGQQAGRSDSTQAARDSLRTRAAYRLPPMIVTASVEPVRQDQAGFASSVARAEEIAAEPTTYASGVLRRLPSVFIDEGAGPGGPTVIRIRGGEEPYTKVLWDGVPININGGFLDIQGLTLTNVERVEVARAPQSAPYGSSAVSGVVQFITRRGTVGPPHFEFGWEGGGAAENGGSSRGEVTVRGGSRRLLYSAGGGITYDRGIYPLPNNAWANEGSLRLDALASPRLSITAIGRYADISTNLPVRNAGATRVPLDPNQRDARNRLTSSLSATFDATPTWRHRLSTSVLWDDFFYADMRDGVMQPSGFFIPDYSLTATSTILRTSAEYTGTNRLSGAGSRALSVSYGATVEREATEDDLTGDFGDSQLPLHRTSGAIFAETQAAAGRRLSVIVGTRAEKNQGLNLQFTPQASAVVSLVPDRFTIRGAVGRAFKTPNLQQQFLDNPFTVPNPSLSPETSVSWEAGLGFAPLASRVHGSATYFRQAYTNLIRTVAVPGTQKQTNKNLGKSRAQGIELDLTYEASARWLLGANGTWVKTEVLDNTGLSPDEYPLGEALPFRPTVTGSGFAQLSMGRVSTVLRGTLVGEQTVLTERFTGQRVVTDGYALVGLTVTYDASRNFSVYARVDNLFNKYYETGFDRRGVPLTAAAGVRVSP